MTNSEKLLQVLIEIHGVTSKEVRRYMKKLEITMKMNCEDCKNLDLNGGTCTGAVPGQRTCISYQPVEVEQLQGGKCADCIDYKKNLGICLGASNDWCEAFRPMDTLGQADIKSSLPDDPYTETKPDLGDILVEASSVINGERQDTYGAPEDSFKIIAEFWDTYLKFRKEGPINPMDVAEMMTLFKGARRLGQKADRDNFRDGIGYMAIAADRLS